MAGGTRKERGLPWEAVFLSLFISAVSLLSISPSLSSSTGSDLDILSALDFEHWQRESYC